MFDTIIKVEGLYKKFCRTLRRSMFYGVLDITRSMLGISYDTDKLRKGEFWALENVSFELKKGEILGIIGANGSGKSTLLRLLTGIFPPDRGKIFINGKVSALIAVGAGIHPHMSGKENIYLNGTILGMSKKEINQKFNQIVDFADIGDFLEAPVSVYSSGMKVRLGFSIAIHCEPEILLIDEVLAVGDIKFRKKCLNKLEEFRKDKSIIFISHNMYQIERICSRAILLDKGKKIAEGAVEEIIDKYYNNTIKEDLEKGNNLIILESTGDIVSLFVKFYNSLGEETETFNFQDDIIFEFIFESKEELINPIIGFTIVNSEGIYVTNTKSINVFKNLNIEKGLNNIKITLKQASLLPDSYKLVFKWKKKNNSNLISAASKKFIIKSNTSLLNHDGIVKMNFDWKNINS